MRQPLGVRIALPVLAMAVVAMPSFAALAADATQDRARLAQHLKSGAILQWFPAGDLFPPAIADPHRVTFAFVPARVLDNNIPQTGDTRYTLKLGGNFGIVRRHPEGDPERGWQVSFRAGFDGIFDVENGMDNIGWDGDFGWYFNLARPGGWAFRAAWQHTSSHIGDEYAQTTGRERVEYTRREWVAGLSKRFGRHWRIYGDAGYGHNPGNKVLQEPWRLQAGAEYERRRSLFGERFGWYAALDLSTLEERDWRVDTSAQGGLTLPIGRRTHRFGIEVYDGRVPLGEFYQITETYVALGIWIDIDY